MLNYKRVVYLFYQVLGQEQFGAMAMAVLGVVKITIVSSSIDRWETKPLTWGT